MSQHQTSHSHHAKCWEVTGSLCDSIPASSYQCHLHGNPVSYITLSPPYSHCFLALPYHSITMSHRPCLSVTTSHCDHTTCHHHLSRVFHVRLIAAEERTSGGAIPDPHAETNVSRPGNWAGIHTGYWYPQAVPIKGLCGSLDS